VAFVAVLAQIPAHLPDMRLRAAKLGLGYDVQDSHHLNNPAIIPAAL
jgi:hypothetical protein